MIETTTHTSGRCHTATDDICPTPDEYRAAVRVRSNPVWLRRSRERLQLTHREIGSLSGVAPSTVGHIENGRSHRLPRIVLLCRTLAERDPAFVAEAGWPVARSAPAQLAVVPEPDDLNDDRFIVPPEIVAALTARDQLEKLAAYLDGCSVVRAAGVATAIRDAIDQLPVVDDLQEPAA